VAGLDFATGAEVLPPEETGALATGAPPLLTLPPLLLGAGALEVTSLVGALEPPELDAGAAVYDSPATPDEAGCWAAVVVWP
jgi:hypothetical protein